MTYRRLYLWLCAVSTLVLAGVWWHSLAYYSSCHVEFPGGYATGRLDRGSVSIQSGPWTTRGWNASGGSEPMADVRHILNATSPLGRFSLRSRTYAGTPPREHHFVSVPLWAIWLTFLGVTFLICRWLEKRAGAVVEKKLARSGTADNVTGQPG